MVLKRSCSNVWSKVWLICSGCPTFHVYIVESLNRENIEGWGLRIEIWLELWVWCLYVVERVNDRLVVVARSVRRTLELSVSSGERLLSWVHRKLFADRRGVFVCFIDVKLAQFSVELLRVILQSLSWTTIQ